MGTWALIAVAVVLASCAAAWRWRRYEDRSVGFQLTIQVWQRSGQPVLPEQHEDDEDGDHDQGEVKPPVP